MLAEIRACTPMQLTLASSEVVDVIIYRIKDNSSQQERPNPSPNPNPSPSPSPSPDPNPNPNPKGAHRQGRALARDEHQLLHRRAAG